jgi:hypothetical protein
MKARAVLTHTLALLLAALTIVPASASASTVFDGNFDTGSLSQWSLKQMCDPSRATVYTASSQSTWPKPAQGTHALRFRVLNSDISPCTPTGNPRAQIATGKILQSGREYWQSFKVLFPNAWPSTSSWQLFQEDYGAPWNGSPPLGFSTRTINGIDTMTLDRGKNHNYDRIWAKPLQRNHWYTFMVRKYMSTSNSAGYVELWIDGAQQKFSNGATRMYTNTLASDYSGAYQFFLNSYRAVNTASVNEIFFDGAKIGTTRTDVETTTTSPTPTTTLSASFTYSPTAPIAGQTTVQFDGSASTGASSYSWSLDGRTSLSGVKPTFKFMSAGTKHVTLTVTGADGAKKSVAKDIVVK